MSPGERLPFGLAVVGLALALPAIGGLAGEASAQARDSTDWYFVRGDPAPLELPEAIRSHRMMSELEYYDGGPYRGLRADLDGDSIPEYIVESAPSLCGNGGCAYALFRGAGHEFLGLIGGNQVYVRARRIGGLPVLNTVWHLNVASVSYQTVVYDGDSYVTVSSVVVGEGSLDALIEDLERARDSAARDDG